MSGPVTIRDVRAGDASRLRAIMLASKAHWGYPRDEVAAWVAQTDFSDDALRASGVRVAEADGEVVAWSALLRKGEVAWLEDMWVDPPFIGRGIGTQLFRDAVERARADGAARLEWEAEPNAVGFYELMGGRHVRDGLSEWGRVNPIMALELEAFAPPRSWNYSST